MHTKGEWTADEARMNVFGIVNGEKELIAQIAPMPAVGGHTDLCAQRGREMELANLHLVKAAPLLGAALEKLVAAIVIGVEVEKGSPVFIQAQAALQAAKLEAFDQSQKAKS